MTSPNNIMLKDKDWLDKWNELHCKLIHKGADYRNKKMADFLEETILEAKKIYYNTGESIMSDQAYDRFENYLRILRPDSNILVKVGS